MNSGIPRMVSNDAYTPGGKADTVKRKDLNTDCVVASFQHPKTADDVEMIRRFYNKMLDYNRNR